MRREDEGPERRAFKQQRCGAKERGIAWELEYWEWLQIWQDSGHLHERGPRKGQWVMSRPGDKGPYAAWNVKIVHCETNDAENAIARHARTRATGRRRKGT